MKIVTKLILIVLILKGVLDLSYISGSLEILIEEIKRSWHIIHCYYSHRCSTSDRLWRHIPTIISFSMMVFLSLSMVVGLLLVLKEKKFRFNNWLKIPVLFYSFTFIVQRFLRLFYDSGIDFSEMSNFETFRYYFSVFLTLVLVIVCATYAIMYNKQNKIEEPIDVSRNNKIRFVNFLIDFFIICFLTIRIQPSMEFSLKMNIPTGYIFLALGLFYYIFLESVYKQTVGKVITNTMVYSSNNYFSSIIKRTILRYMPFEPFSFLVGYEKGWHDRFSKTGIIKVVN